MTLLAVVLCSVILAGCGTAATPLAPVSQSASARVSSPEATGGACHPGPTSGCLTVVPVSASVGATVTLDGTGCQNANQPTYLVFEGEAGVETGTLGAVGTPNIPTDAAGHFHASFTIPADLHSLQERGGGAVRPGTYDFASKPPACLIQFTVTAS